LSRTQKNKFSFRYLSLSTLSSWATMCSAARPRQVASRFLFWRYSICKWAVYSSWCTCLFRTCIL
jgi:hypothetical protein